MGNNFMYDFAMGNVKWHYVADQRPSQEASVIVYTTDGMIYEAMMRGNAYKTRSGMIVQRAHMWAYMDREDEEEHMAGRKEICEKEFVTKNGFVRTPNGNLFALDDLSYIRLAEDGESYQVALKSSEDYIEMSVEDGKALVYILTECDIK